MNCGRVGILAHSAAPTSSSRGHFGLLRLQRLGAFENHLLMRTSPSSNDSNSRSRRLYQAVAKISVLVRRRWTRYKCATNGGGDVGPGHTGNVGTAHSSRISGRFSPPALAPAAPPLPAQPAIRRDRPDENAPSRLYRRSKPPPTPRPQRSACDNRNRRRADSR
jgi:hypothetical protein